MNNLAGGDEKPTLLCGEAFFYEKNHIQSDVFFIIVFLQKG